MSPENFCYWLQGLMEIAEPTNLSEQQVKIIKDHLSLVFNKVTPNYKIDPGTFWKNTGSIQLMDHKVLTDFKDFDPIVSFKNMESC